MAAACTPQAVAVVVWLLLGSRVRATATEPLPSLGIWYDVCDMTVFGADTVAKGGTQNYVQRSQPLGTPPSIWSFVVNASSAANGTLVSYQGPPGATVVGYDPNGESKDQVDCNAFPSVDAYFRWRQAHMASNRWFWVSQRPSPQALAQSFFKNGSAFLVLCTVQQPMYTVQEVEPAQLVVGSLLTRALARLPSTLDPGVDPAGHELLREFQQQFKSGYLTGATFGGLLELDVQVRADVLGSMPPSDVEKYAAQVAANCARNRTTMAGVPASFQKAVLSVGTGDEGVGLFSVVQGGEHAVTNTSVAQWRGSLAASPGLIGWTCAPWDGIITEGGLQAQRAVLSQYRALLVARANRRIAVELAGIGRNRTEDRRNVVSDTFE